MNTDSRRAPARLFRPGGPAPRHVTALGALYAADCLELLPRLRAGVVDTVFADPPFNLGKAYGRRTDDRLPEGRYLEWCRAWLAECVRVLRPGGALFLYNLPRWNLLLGAWLVERGLTFRHWIAVEQSAGLPIPGRLHPSHYSLLYLTQGPPRTFRRIRTPIARCRHCGGEIKDYGGHRGAMNPLGVTLKDVWTDIPPVRHWKFKSRKRRANALSTKLVERAVEMSTAPGDLVLDPFGGSGTTFAVCERTGRRWLGIEIDYCDQIVERLADGRIERHANADVVDA
ncbi:MAG: site-specific DNA-methyltransferase [Planctomycetes bacterium]|nr:site-specific DNA-methyltransferase [Planctomycetota bacterium]